VVLHRPDPPPFLAGLLGRSRPPQDRRRTLGPLDDDALGDLVVSYSLDQGDVPLRALREETDGLPGPIHVRLERWARERAEAKLRGSAERVGEDRTRMRSAEAELAHDVEELERVRRSRGSSGEQGHVCPFKGLASFDAEDADFFFGRERLVAELVARLAGTAFLAVVGPSGSGKSSVVRAGLIPALGAGTLPGSDGWRQTLMRPGNRPLAEMRRVLGFTRSSASSSTQPRQVIVIDQFEEAFTVCADDAERDGFVDALTGLAHDLERRVLVVVAIRADYYGRCAAYPDLAKLLGANHVLVGPMDDEELRRAIELPARRAGLRAEPSLVDALVADVVAEPGGLPLLSTTLLELWMNRSGRDLTDASYRRLGGVRGAVARLAEAAYGRLRPEQRGSVRGVFLRLAGPGEGDRAVRRRVRLAELDLDRNEPAREILDAFTEARLLTRSEDSVELAHEAILREWPRLHGWLEEDAEGRRLLAHLTQTAQGWHEGGRDDAELYRGARLASAMDFTSAHTADLNVLEREFLETSRVAADRQAVRQRTTNRRLRALLIGTALFLALSIVAGLVAVGQRDRADRANVHARARELSAAADASIADDPERSVYLALEAVDLLSPSDASLWLEAQESLQRAVAASREVRTFDRSSQTVVFAPDGAFLAVTDGDEHRAVALLDPATGEELRRIANHSDEILGIDVSPDGGRLATASADGTAAVWDVGSGANVATLTGHTDRVLSAEFSPDGRRIATISLDRTARLWNLRGNELRSFEAYAGGGELFPEENADMVAFTPDGQRLVVAHLGFDVFVGTAATVWNVASGARELTLTFPGVWAQDVAVSPDGSMIAVGSGSGPSPIFDAETGHVLFRFQSVANVFDVEFDRSGERLATTAFDNRVRVWTISREGPLESITLAGHAAITTDVSFGPDGLLATGSVDGTVRLWDVTYPGARPAMTLAGAGTLNGDVDFAPDGRHLIASASPDGWVQVLDLERGERVRSLDSGGPFLGVDVSPDGRTFATAAQDDERSVVTIWSVASGQRVNTIEGGSGCAQASFCPVFDVAISPDGGRVAIASFDAVIRVFDVVTGTTIAELSGHEAPEIFGLELSPDGSRLASASWDGTVRIWSLDGHSDPLLIDPESGQLTAVDFSPDGGRVFSVGFDGFLRVWDAATGALQRQSKLHAGGLFDVSVSPDGRSLAVAGARVLLVDDATLDETLSFGGGASRLDFSADGSMLATISGEGGPVRIWALDPDDLRRVALDRLTRPLDPDQCRRFDLEPCPRPPAEGSAAS
jgi:WD40 repeat protein